MKVRVGMVIFLWVVLVFFSTFAVVSRRTEDMGSSVDSGKFVCETIDISGWPFRTIETRSNDCGGPADFMNGRDVYNYTEYSYTGIALNMLLSTSVSFGAYQLLKQRAQKK